MCKPEIGLKRFDNISPNPARLTTLSCRQSINSGLFLTGVGVATKEIDHERMFLSRLANNNNKSLTVSHIVFFSHISNALFPVFLRLYS